MNIVTLANFTPISSVKLTTGAASASITFSSIALMDGATYMITNTGSSGAYVFCGIDSATAAATSSTPDNGNIYIAAGSIMILDYPPNYNTIAAIQSGAATTLEISLGYGN